MPWSGNNHHRGTAAYENGCWTPDTKALQISFSALTSIAAHLVHLEICQQPGLTDLLPLTGEQPPLETGCCA